MQTESKGWRCRCSMKLHLFKVVGTKHVFVLPPEWDSRTQFSIINSHVIFAHPDYFPVIIDPDGSASALEPMR